MDASESKVLAANGFSERHVVDMLSEGLRYEDIAAETGTSRGTVYRIACKHQARKQEAKIVERREDLKRRQREFLQEILNSTQTMDVLDFLAGVPDNAVSLTCTSPPYNVGKSYGDGTSADALRHVHFCGWMMQIVSELARVTKPGGVVFLQVGQTRDESGGLYPMDVMLFDALKRSGLTYQSRVVWEIPHGLTPKGRLAERYETVLVFSKGDQPTFNPNAARAPQKQPGKRAFKGPNKGQLSGHPFGAYPSNLWKIGNVGHNHPEKTGHPAQMPLELARRAILLYTVAGDLVLDAFSGSGTTHAAAIQTGRAFVGADLFYEDVRTKRLANIQPDSVSMLPGVSDESVAVWQADVQRVDTPADPTFDPNVEWDLFSTTRLAA
jgi:DNA modification methylase